MTMRYIIDIVETELFVEQFERMRETFEVLGYPNGNHEVSFEVNERTTQWMLENYCMFSTREDGPIIWNSEPLWFYMTKIE